MTGNRRRSILAIAALLIAGCGANIQASAQASAPASAPPSPSAVPTPVSSPAASVALPSPLPPPMIEGCIGVDEIEPASPFVDAGASLGHVSVDLQVTRIKERSGQRRSVTPPVRELSNDGVGVLLGGHEFLTYPSTYFEGHKDPLTMKSALVTLTLDGASAVELPVRFVAGNEYFNQVAVDVPDGSGRGTLAFEFAWTDRCFRLEAAGSVRVDVVPLATTAGCEMKQAAYWDQLEALLDKSLLVGTTVPKPMSPFSQAKYAPYLNPGIDAAIVYGFDPDQPAISAAPGSAIRIENQKPDLKLGADMELWVWTRRSVATAVKDWPPYGVVEVLHRTPTQQADGSFRLRVPEDPGRYVAGVEHTFESSCSTGTMWTVVNIEVVAPSASPS